MYRTKLQLLTSLLLLPFAGLVLASCGTISVPQMPPAIMCPSPNVESAVRQPGQTAICEYVVQPFQARALPDGTAIDCLMWCEYDQSTIAAIAAKPIDQLSPIERDALSVAQADTWGRKFHAARVITALEQTKCSPWSHFILIPRPTQPPRPVPATSALMTTLPRRIGDEDVWTRWYQARTRPTSGDQFDFEKYMLRVDRWDPVVEPKECVSSGPKLLLITCLFANRIPKDNASLQFGLGSTAYLNTKAIPSLGVPVRVHRSTIPIVENPIPTPFPTQW